MAGVLWFNVELVNEAALERAFAEAARAASDGLRQAVVEGLRVGEEYARRSHPHKDQTGRLTGSVRGRLEVSTPGAAVGVLEARAPYAKFVERGTQPHVIEARRRKALHWEDGGGHRFARRVQHPGTEPRPFMAPAADVAQRHIERSIELDILLNVERALAAA